MTKFVYFCILNGVSIIAMEPEYLSTGKAAKMLGVTPTTLRSWDKQGKFTSIRTPGGHRLFSTKKLRIFLGDSLKETAAAWLQASPGTLPAPDFYCPTSAIFQARVSKLERALFENLRLHETLSLIVAAASEIGNNSFDHNIGNWPDVPGIFFGYDLARGEIVLADRGQGVLQTLCRVKPELDTHQAALKTAFTEIISGRAPEERGNGLKFVRRVAPLAHMNIVFQSGDAIITILKDATELQFRPAPTCIQGCLAHFTFEN